MGSTSGRFVEDSLSDDAGGASGGALSRWKLKAMERFSKQEFDRAGDKRNLLRADLALMLTERLKSAPHFHRAVYASVAELKAAGHDLTSYDESDEMQVWGPDYVGESGPGLVITFTAPDEVSVEWSEQ